MHLRKHGAQVRMAERLEGEMERRLNRATNRERCWWREQGEMRGEWESRRKEVTRVRFGWWKRRFGGEPEGSNDWKGGEGEKKRMEDGNGRATRGVGLTIRCGQLEIEEENLGGGETDVGTGVENVGVKVETSLGREWIGWRSVILHVVPAERGLFMWGSSSHHRQMNPN